MARKRTPNTNLLGRSVECTDESTRLAAHMDGDEVSDRRLPTIVFLHRHGPCEVVGTYREDGSSWIDIATPEGIQTVMATQVRIHVPTGGR